MSNLFFSLLTSTKMDEIYWASTKIEKKKRMMKVMRGNRIKSISISNYMSIMETMLVLDDGAMISIYVVRIDPVRFLFFVPLSQLLCC